MPKMLRPLIVKQLNYDLTPVAGLALVGHCLKAAQPVLGRIDAALPVKGGVINSDIVRSYLGLLVQGKSDFDAIVTSRRNPATRSRHIPASWRGAEVHLEALF